MDRIASSFHRVVAGFIDILSAIVLALLPLWWFFSATSIDTVLDRLFILIVMLLMFYPVYFALVVTLMVAFLGGTLGKLFTGTKIIDINGKNLSLKKAFFRNYLGYVVSGLFFGLGFWWILKDKDKRGWHDMMVDSYVLVKYSWGLMVGIVVTLIFLALNIYLGSQIYKNFEKNKYIYVEIMEDFSQELDKKPLENLDLQQNSLPQTSPAPLRMD